MRAAQCPPAMPPRLPQGGSACVLRCGRDAWASCHAIVEALRAGLRKARLPECAVSLIEDTSHASANELMTADGW